MDRAALPVAATAAAAWLALTFWVVSPGAAIAAERAERSVAPGELEAALAQSSQGDTLRLLTGVHRGPVEISTAVKLLAEPGAVLEGDGSGTVLRITADAIEISGLLVRGSGSDLSTDDAAILIDGANQVTIRGCRVEARAFGVYLKGGGNHVVESNQVIGQATLSRARRGNGIHLWHSEHNQILDNELADVRDGVYLSFAHDNLIRGNHGHSLRYGIHYMFSERNRLLGNRFDHSTGGIALMFSLDNRIEGNQTTGNQRFGILCQQVERSELVANVVAGNGRGFYLENSATNLFEGNRMEGNGVGAYLTAGSEQNVFVGNFFERNLVQVYRDHAGRNRWWENERGNHWSDYAGFDWNGDGVGELPYRLETTSSALLARRPEAGWFWGSPLFTLLDWWDARWVSRDGANDPIAFDLFPLMPETASPATRVPAS